MPKIFKTKLEECDKMIELCAYFRKYGTDFHSSFLVLVAFSFLLVPFNCCSFSV